MGSGRAERRSAGQGRCSRSSGTAGDYDVGRTVASEAPPLRAYPALCVPAPVARAAADLPHVSTAGDHGRSTSGRRGQPAPWRKPRGGSGGSSRARPTSRGWSAAPATGGAGGRTSRKPRPGLQPRSVTDRLRSRNGPGPSGCRSSDAEWTRGAGAERPATGAAPAAATTAAGPAAPTTTAAAPPA